MLQLWLERHFRQNHPVVCVFVVLHSPLLVLESGPRDFFRATSNVIAINLRGCEPLLKGVRVGTVLQTCPASVSLAVTSYHVIV